MEDPHKGPLRQERHFADEELVRLAIVDALPGLEGLAAKERTICTGEVGYLSSLNGKLRTCNPSLSVQRASPDLPCIHTGLVEGLVQVRIFAKTQPNLTSYGWQFEISHRNKVLQLPIPIALGLGWVFAKILT